MILRLRECLSTINRLVGTKQAAGPGQTSRRPQHAFRPRPELLEDRCLLAGTGLYAEYYDNIDFTSLKLTRANEAVNFNWGSGSPNPSIGSDTFSVRWTGQVVPKFSQTYTFYTRSDDGVRLWVDGQLIIDNWTDHSLVEDRGTIALVAGQSYSIRMDYYENTGPAVAMLLWSSPSEKKQPIPPTQLYPARGLYAEYFDNIDLTNQKFTQVISKPSFNWGLKSPASPIQPDTFSVRWSGMLESRASETYTFYTTSDDGVRLWVNNQLIVDNWTDHTATTNTGTIALAAGERYNLQLDYYDNTGPARIDLFWSSPSRSKQLVPVSQLHPNRSPVQPVITEPNIDGKVVNPADVHMETAPFADSDVRDSHICSDFEIYTAATGERVWVTPCIGGVEKVHTHLGDGTFEGSLAGQNQLLFDTDYRLRVRHRDSSGNAATEWSPWSERLFHTSLSIPGDPNQQWAARQLGYVVETVATGFQLPVNLAFLPNPGPQATDPLYYVSELYGTIKVVARNGAVSDYATGLLNFNPTGNFPGSGEQGLTGIVVDPATGDVFAGMLYSTNPANDAAPHYPKVVRLHSSDGGRTASTQSTILDMVGETQGQSHQISNISIGPDNMLYVHMGDGFNAGTAQNLNSYRGKILRMNLDGSAPWDNPFYNASDGINARDYVYAYGFRNPFGGAWRAFDGFHYEVENGPSVDRFARVVAGRNYLWDGSDSSMQSFALYNWSPATAPVNVAFVQPTTFGGSAYPIGKQDHAFVSESGPTWATGPQANGKRISEFVLDASGNLVSGPTPLVEYIGTGKATVAGLAAGPDGLYFTDLYLDNSFDNPIARGANVLRVRFVGSVDFTADVTASCGGPLTVHFSDLSNVPSPSSWFWEFGDGATSNEQNPTHTYTPGIYDVRLTVTNASGPVTVEKKSFIGAGVHRLTGEYYDNIDLTGFRLNRFDSAVDFNWAGGSPDPAIGPDTFSVRWVGQFEPSTTEAYTFYTQTDDGVRLWVNGRLVIDRWVDQGTTEWASVPLNLVAGRKYDIRMEYYENGGAAVAKLLWSTPTRAKAIIPAVALCPVPLGQAAFTANPTAAGAAPLAVQFTDVTAVQSPTSWLWEFGDGTTSTLPNPSHTYAGAGIYDVRLTVTNALGEVRSAEKKSLIGIGNVGLMAQYFDNRDLTGLALTRIDPTVNFDWGGGSPDPSIAVNTFSVRWTGQILPRFSETYTFYTVSDDGVRLWVNGQLIIDNWTDHAPTENSGTITLLAGTKYDIKLEFYENGGGAVAKLSWSSLSQPKQIVPQSQLYPSV
jgi:PKD repeat protein